jgi:hypothetical protein
LEQPVAPVISLGENPVDQAVFRGIRRGISKAKLTQYLNLTAVFRASRWASKPGWARAIFMTASMAAMMTAASMFWAVHSLNGSSGLGKLSVSG